VDEILKLCARGRLTGRFVPVMCGQRLAQHRHPPAVGLHGQVLPSRSIAARKVRPPIPKAAEQEARQGERSEPSRDGLQDHQRPFTGK